MKASGKALARAARVLETLAMPANVSSLGRREVKVRLAGEEQPSVRATQRVTLLVLEAGWVEPGLVTDTPPLEGAEGAVGRR